MDVRWTSLYQTISIFTENRRPIELFLLDNLFCSIICLVRAAQTVCWHFYNYTALQSSPQGVVGIN